MQIPPQSEAGGLWTARLRLRFQLKRQHFVQGHVTLKCTASIYSEYFTSTAAIYPGLGLGEKALESRRTNGMSIYCTTTIHCAFIRKETQYESYHRMSLFLQSNQNLRLCGKCIVGQSSAKFDKVDMFSKQAIKKQSWQSWCIFLSILKILCRAKLAKLRCESIILGKVGKVQISLF